MKWVYNISNANTWNVDGTSGVQKILLRPVWIENNLEYTSGIVELRITSLQFIDEVIALNKFDEAEISFFDEIKKKMSGQGYYIDEQELDKNGKELYINRADLYVTINYNLVDLL